MSRSRDKGEPEIIARIVERWLKQSGLDSDWQKYKVFAVWNTIIDDAVREHTRPRRFMRQVLEITVDSPTYRFELANFHRSLLLQKLQEQCDIYVRDIRFVFTGKFHTKKPGD